MSEPFRPHSRIRRPAVWIPLAAAALAVTAATVVWSSINSSSGQAAANATGDATRGSGDTQSSADPASANPPDGTAEELLPGVSFPAGFSQVSERTGETVGLPVIVTRFQSQPDIPLGGEQVSVARTPEGNILGYIDFRLPEPDAGQLPTPEQAERDAFALLNRVDAEYAAGLTVQWVDTHDEAIVDADGTERTLAGMKVKTVHENGRYTWVIYGADSRVIAYERDIPWNGEVRVTGAWLEERDGVTGGR